MRCNYCLSASIMPLNSAVADSGNAVKRIMAHCGAIHPTALQRTSPQEFPDLAKKAIDLFHADAGFAAAMKKAEPLRSTDKDGICHCSLGT